MGSLAKTIVTIVLLVGVIAAATYFAVKKSKPAEEGLGYEAVLICSAPGCGKVFEDRVIAGKPPPFRCKRCGKMTAYRAVKCSDCGKTFPLVVREDPTRPESEEIRTEECPNCGSRSFGLIQTKEDAEKAKPREE